MEEVATILSIEEISNDEDYVYDIETQVGTFSTDTGLILKNTDSCYVKFLVDKSKYNNEMDYLAEHFRLADECAARITKTFKKPIDLEFEKVMYPFFLFKKKRYAYLEWVYGKDKQIECAGADYKGLQTVRRDTCQYVKDVLVDILEAGLGERDKDIAVKKISEIAKKGVKDLLHDKVPKEKLRISKSLSATYKVEGEPVPWTDPRIKHPQVYLAQQIKKIDPMTYPRPPDRVPYYFIQNSKKNALQCEKVVHPDYMTKKDKIDALYYFEHQMQSPLDQVFDIFLDDPSVLYKEEAQKRKNKDKGTSRYSRIFWKVQK